MNGRLCLIHEGPEADLPYLPHLRAEVSVVSVRIHEIDIIDDFIDMPCLIDIDLTEKHVVETLARKLPHVGRMPRLFVVDTGDRLARVQAGVLGATASLPRPVVPAAALEILVPALNRQTLATDLGSGVVPADAPGASSILAADDALGELFSACLTDGLIDFERIKGAGHQVAGTISDIGLDPWMETVRRHHRGTYQHSLLVTGLAVGFGTVLAMNTRDLERLALVGLLHDVGKAQVPVQLLDKPSRLADHEFAVMKKHPQYGFDFLARTSPDLDPSIVDAVVHHHEMLDGSGYPHGLTANALPDLTRVMTVCDIYAALAEKRAYKAPMETSEILRILGTLVDQGKLERALVRALAAVVTGDDILIRNAAVHRGRAPIRRNA
jgi:HD-GYP domain-containing protein (c-di-GMP phosphodiesterase class II)